MQISPRDAELRSFLKKGLTEKFVSESVLIKSSIGRHGATDTDSIPSIEDGKRFKVRHYTVPFL